MSGVVTGVWALLSSVLRIVFLRGSPERIAYTRRLFIAAQALFWADHLVFVILRVFAEFTMFMLMMVMLTARIARYRLARMMLVLVLISLLADTLLIIFSGLSTHESASYLAYAIAAVAAYGASSCLSWGLKRPLWYGAACLGLYLAATVGLDLIFRELYGIMVAG